MPMTTAARAIALASQFGDDASTVAPSTLYFALFDADPGGAGVEPDSTGAYARVAMANDSTTWGAIGSSDTQISNVGGAIVWPTSSGVWSILTELTHWGIFDNSVGGNLLYSGELLTGITITGAGDTARIPAGALTIIQEA